MVPQKQSPKAEYTAIANIGPYPVVIFKTVQHIFPPFEKLHQNTLAIGPHIGKL